MAGLTAGGALGSEFDGFLFAAIGIDSNNMSVTVLSGMARSDMDPWQEAARLAALPGIKTVEALTAWLGALPGWRWTPAEAHALAARLVALLPGQRVAGTGSNQPSSGCEAVTASRPVWIYVVFIVFMIGSQLILTNHVTSPAANFAERDPGTQVPQPEPPMSSVQ